jgi:hypothetical protein
MIFLLPAYLFDYKGWFKGSADRRNNIPCSKKGKLEEGISFLVVIKVS